MQRGKNVSVCHLMQRTQSAAPRALQTRELMKKAKWIKPVVGRVKSEQNGSGSDGGQCAKEQ